MSESKRYRRNVANANDAPSDWRLGVRPGTLADGPIVNWKNARGRAYATLIAAKGRHDIAAAPLVMPSWSHWCEPLQEAVTHVLADWTCGAWVPLTEDDVVVGLVRRARNFDDARRKKARRHLKLIEENGIFLSETIDRADLADLFDEICRRDLKAKLFAQLYDCLPARGRAVLTLVFEKGVDFRDNNRLARELHLKSAQEAHNAKRMIIYQSNRIMRDLVGDSERGGSHD